MLYRRFSTLLRVRLCECLGKQRWLEIKGTHQFLVDVDEVNILGGDVCTILKNTEALTPGSKEI